LRRRVFICIVFGSTTPFSTSWEWNDFGIFAKDGRKKRKISVPPRPHALKRATGDMLGVVTAFRNHAGPVIKRGGRER
jgi:hypothetical protein